MKKVSGSRDERCGKMNLEQWYVQSDTVVMRVNCVVARHNQPKVETALETLVGLLLDGDDHWRAQALLQ